MYAAMSTLTGHRSCSPCTTGTDRAPRGRPRRASRRRRIAAHDLDQQAGTATGRVLLVARRHVAGAHHAAVGPPALPDPDAALGRRGEAAAVVREREHRRRPRRGGSRARDAGPGPAAAGPRPCRGSCGRRGSQMDLNSRNASTSSGPNIFGSSSARALAVAVLARQRSPVAHDQIRRLLDEARDRRRRRPACGGRSHAVVHAPVAEVAVQRARRSRTGRPGREGRAGSRRAVRTGTPRPPSPPRCCADRARCAVAARPDSRNLPHLRCSCASTNSRMRGRGFAPADRRIRSRAAAGRLIPVSRAELGQQPAARPPGSSDRLPACRPLARIPSTMTWSNPSSPIGRPASTSGTASAAA